MCFSTIHVSQFNEKTLLTTAIKLELYEENYEKRKSPLRE